MFLIYCDRIKNKERLTDPVISNIEKYARAILEQPASNIGYSSYFELADACLIATTIASAKAHNGSGSKWNKNIVEMALSGRVRMFGLESLHWVDDAKNGKGYWFDHLKFN